MVSSLNLKIITPDRVVFDDAVDQVVVNAVDGELCVLPDHEPLMTALSIDVLRFKHNKEDGTAAVMGGIMEVQNNEVTVMSDLAELDIEIDAARAKEEMERLEAEKTQKIDKLDVYLSEMSIAKRLARIRAAELSRIRRGRVER